MLSLDNQKPNVAFNLYPVKKCLACPCRERHFCVHCKRASRMTQLEHLLLLKKERRSLGHVQFVIKAMCAAV
jgi:hypothetical protein